MWDVTVCRHVADAVEHVDTWSSARTATDPDCGRADHRRVTAICDQR
jgi:hypothetical protein